LDTFDSVSLRQYYRSFVSISGIMAGLFSSVPILSKIAFPGSDLAYGFPPLGSIEDLARIFTVVLAVAATYFAFFVSATPPARNRRRLASAMVLTFLSICLYLAFFLAFVRKIDIPSKNTSVHVSVGWERTEFAKANFGAESDSDLLRDRGISDEEILRLWTKKSVVISRLGLFVTYSLFILSLVVAFSWGVLDQSTHSNKQGTH
jgi:hypothetical protein